MTHNLPLDPVAYVSAIQESGLSIYDPIAIGDANLWIPTPELELLLDDGLRGLSLAGLPIRTRSKVVKEKICQVLGYPIPKSFQKVQPRFKGQQFDTYIQKSNNLQIWNEELSPTRRYVIIRVSATDLITKVKVVTGDTLAQLDTTGTLTGKYQARFTPGGTTTELITPTDTQLLVAFTSSGVDLRSVESPVLHPASSQLLPIQEVFSRLVPLVGQSFADAGRDQERNRGAALHRLVCNALGYPTYQDDGQFPDIRHQLIEVKLQTSPTIDLGIALPTEAAAIDVPMIEQTQIRHCDVRYAVFYAVITGGIVTLTNLVVTTGEAFFTRFEQFGGRVINRKLQIPLPSAFFGE